MHARPHSHPTPSSRREPAAPTQQMQQRLFTRRAARGRGLKEGGPARKLPCLRYSVHTNTPQAAAARDVWPARLGV
eukprot:7407805-Pyramimonas_sp.AAC.1